MKNISELEMQEPMSGNKIFNEGFIDKKTSKKNERIVSWKIDNFQLDRLCELNSPFFNLGKWDCFFRFRHVTTYNKAINSSWGLFVVVCGPFDNHCVQMSCRTELFTGSIFSQALIASYPTKKKECVEETNSSLCFSNCSLFSSYTFI